LTFTPSFSLTCGNTSSQTFTVNNPNNVTGITEYKFDLGSSSNGWLYNGSDAPQIINNVGNSITLTPKCGAIPSNIAVSVYQNNNLYKSYNCAVNMVNPTLSITSSSANSGNVICNGASATYSFNGLPCGSIVTWSLPSGSLSSIDCNTCGTPTITATSTGNENLSLQATATGGCLQANTAPVIQPVQIGANSVKIVTWQKNKGNFTDAYRPKGLPIMDIVQNIDEVYEYYSCYAGKTIYSNLDIQNAVSVKFNFINYKGSRYSFPKVSYYGGKQYPNLVSFNLAHLGESVTLQIIAVDLCGNISESDYNFKADANAPAPPAPCNHYTVNQSTIGLKTIHVSVSNNITAPCYARMAKDESPLTTETIEAILIYNKGGEVVKKIGVENLDSKMTDINLSDLDEGTYIIEIRGLKEYKELLTFHLYNTDEIKLAEDIATGNVIINKKDADDRLYVMQLELFNELMTTKTYLLENSDILKSFVEKAMGGSFEMAFNINNLLENNEIDKANDLLSFWIPTNQIDKNYIRYFNYYIRFKNGDEFGDDEIQDMFDLASMCPLTSGEIINAQRTLYYYITKDNTSFDYTCNAPDATCVRTLSNPEICTTTTSDPKQINRFKVFQDGDTPTNLDVMVDNTTLDEFAKLNFNTDDLLNEQIQNVRVYDAAGNLAIEKDNIADKKVSIDLSGLDEGSYYIQIDGNKEYKEQQNFKYTIAKSEAQVAEDIASGKTVINTSEADDRREVMKHQLYKELRGNYDLLNRSSILQDFYVRHKKSDIGMINKINDAFNNYDITTAQNLIANWQPHNKQGQNCLDYYNHFINYLNGEKPSEEEINNIYTLANGCSQIEGEIVFAARSLYNYFTQAGDDFSSACGGTGLRVKNHTTPVTRKVKHSETNTVIYPNPSNGNFTIKFPFSTSGLNTVKVLDQTGKILLQKTVISGVQNISLNQGIASGLYTVQITNSVTGKTENQKLIVNKQ